VRLAQPLRIPVFASGGVHNVEHLKPLKAHEEDGIAGVVCGRALYEGTLDFKAAVLALK
jgi:phosphoribosylformimino-5-aminoimidazole carboxamide ribotide isomerase